MVMYVDRHTVCWSTYYMSIEILYVDRQLFPTVKVVYLSEITVTTLTFRDRTADVTYCADVTLFLHATSGGCHRFRHFLWPDFLRCITCYLGSFSRWKTAFSPNNTPQDTLNKTKIDAKWLEVKFVFWFSDVNRRGGWNLIIVNKSIKEAENLICYSVRSNLVSLLNTKACIFTRGYRHSWKYCFWWNKIYLTLKISNILYSIN